jgi:hypothetical protein
LLNNGHGEPGANTAFAFGADCEKVNGVLHGKEKRGLSPVERTIRQKGAVASPCIYHCCLSPSRLFRAIHHGKPPIGEQTLQAPGLKL